MNEIRSQLEQTLDAGLTDETLVKVRKQMAELASDMAGALEDRIKIDISYNLAELVERMADDAI